MAARAAERLACAVCATQPAPGKKLRSCELCKQRGLPATYYCSEECQTQGWPAHNAWHRQQKKWVKQYVVEAVNEHELTIAKRQAQIAERTGSNYDQLLAAATKHTAEHDYRHAARKNREAIALDPLQPVGYFNLACALDRAQDPTKAAEMFLQASELSKDGSEMWVQATAAAFEMLRMPACAEEPKPDWWQDDALKTLSARVIAMAPNSLLAVRMRARVLSGLSPAWEAGPRTAKDFREAADLFLRAAEQAITPADENACRLLAAQLNEMAEAEEAAEATVRAEEEAVAAAARAEAEAKAEAAAAALLAELEVEKATAVVQPSSKGQGKKKGKGKGKR